MGFNILDLCTPEPEDEAISAGQPARVHGFLGLFFVMDVDHQNRTADLISAHGISPVLRQVPFSSVGPPVLVYNPEDLSSC